MFARDRAVRNEFFAICALAQAPLVNIGENTTVEGENVIDPPYANTRGLSADYQTYRQPGRSTNRQKIYVLNLHFENIG